MDPFWCAYTKANMLLSSLYAAGESLDGCAIQLRHAHTITYVTHHMQLTYQPRYFDAYW